MTQKEFVDKFKAAASEAKKKGAIFNERVAIAQSALETGWGNSIPGNNLFGIKCKTGITTGTKEEVNGKMISTTATWRTFDSWVDCIIYYAGMFQRLKWFNDALPYTNGPDDDFLRHILPALKEPGWATDSKYFIKVKAKAKAIESLGGPKWV